MRLSLTMWPNQSPTAVGAVRSAVAVRAVSRRWLGSLGVVPHTRYFHAYYI